jgi:hypothetical protein
MVDPHAAVCGLTIIPVFVKVVIKDELALYLSSVLWPVAVGTVLACRSGTAQQGEHRLLIIIKRHSSPCQQPMHCKRFGMEDSNAAGVPVVCAMDSPQFASEGKGDGLDTAGACRAQNRRC